ncbi:MAG: DUF4838 domain-containing protein [Phycisphaeraceae bacterium]
MKAHVLTIPALALLLLATTAAHADEPAPLTLASDGEARAVIVIGDEPNPVVRFAAQELANKLQAITGAEFRIVAEPPEDGAAIVLGDQPATREAGIDVRELPRDAYVIRTRDQRLFIAGRDEPGERAEQLFDLLADTEVGDRSRRALRDQYNPARWDFQRATAFGVYDFLQQLGARWFFPGPDGEILPERRTLTIEPTDRRETPAFEMRYVGHQHYRKNQVYNDAQEYKAMDWTAEADMLFSLRQRQSTRWLAFNHRPTRHQWEERFGETHPEYFALLKSGKRDLQRLHDDGKHRGHLCYTNAGMFEETLKDARAFFAGEHATTRGIEPANDSDALESNNGWNVRATYGDTFSLLPQDGFTACEHDACQQLVGDDRPDSNGWHSELVWSFVERVARELRDEFPDKKLTNLAYASYTAPPEDIDRLPDNVIVGFVPRISGRFYTYIDDAQHQRYAELMRQWNDVADGPLLVWMNHMYRTKRPARHGVPMILPDVQARFAKLWRDQNARWTYNVYERQDPFMSHLGRYVWYRLLWNPDENVDALIDDYVARLYGPAASPMGRIIEDVRARSIAIAETDAGQIDIWSKHYSAAVLDDYQRWHAEAVDAAEGTQHAGAVEMFGRYFLERMRAGRGWYERNIEAVVESDEANVTVRRAWQDVTIDGRLDENIWQLSDRAAPFRSNQTGEPTEWRTETRMLYTDDTLYFAFVCHDPEASQRSLESGTDTVEIFLDPLHRHDGYYQLMIDMAGRVVEDNYREMLGEPIDSGWDSGAEVAVKRESDRWIVEVALPRDRLEGGPITPGTSREADRPWGVNFCRTMNDPPRKDDRFSTFSPLLRGGFHQPDLFAHMYFD